MTRRVAWQTNLLPEQDEQWESERRAMGYESKSEFVNHIGEAGLKKFDRSDADVGNPDVDVKALRDALAEERELRQQAEERAETWRARAFEHRATEQYLAENPGATTEELRDHLGNTVPLRLKARLRALESEGRVDAEWLENGTVKWTVVHEGEDGEATLTRGVETAETEDWEREREAYRVDGEPRPSDWEALERFGKADEGDEDAEDAADGAGGGE